MMIHCAMHTFQSSDEWTDCCGMRTRVHDPYRAFAIIKADKTHPITMKLPDQWPTAGDELYRTIKLGERSTALFKGKADKLIEEHTVVWVSTYGKGPNYIVVKNEGRGADFTNFEESAAVKKALSLSAQIVTLAPLHEVSMRKIDAQNASFQGAIN